MQFQLNNLNSSIWREAKNVYCIRQGHSRCSSNSSKCAHKVEDVTSNCGKRCEDVSSGEFNFSAKLKADHIKCDVKFYRKSKLERGLALLNEVICQVCVNTF